MNHWIKRMIESLAPAEAGDVRAEEAIAIKYQHRPKSILNIAATTNAHARTWKRTSFGSALRPRTTTLTTVVFPSQHSS